MCTIRPRTVAHVNQDFTNLMKLVALPLSQVFKNSGMQYGECRLHAAYSFFSVTIFAIFWFTILQRIASSLCRLQYTYHFHEMTMQGHRCP